MWRIVTRGIVTWRIVTRGIARGHPEATANGPFPRRLSNRLPYSSAAVVESISSEGT
jgi:hypothetical protein